MYRFRIILTLLFCALLLAMARPAAAVEPRLWREDTQAAFLRGESDGLSLTRNGEVTLAPELKTLANTGEDFVWSLARGSRGTVYAGTGNEGRVYAIDAAGSVKKLFDSPEVSIFSLAVAGDGTVYAGSSPAGLIYKLVPGKEPVTFCRTEEQHVWFLLPDGKGGLLAATGGAQGKVLRINAAGEKTVLAETADHNVMSLVRSGDGTIYAGTDESGLVYRIRNGTSEVLYDARESEIRCLLLRPDGTLYAGAMTGSASAPGPRTRNGGRDPQKNETSSVIYAIRPSGSGFRIWESDDPVLLSLSAEADGSLLAVTGDDGRIYRIHPDGAQDVVGRTAPVRPGAAVAEGGRVLIGGAGSGEILELDGDLSEHGSLTSRPRDFALVSTWGKIALKADVPGASAVSVQVRSGNSEEPDEAWSAWSSDLRDGAANTAPPARFLQYRLNLKRGGKRDAPVLREVRLSGLQENVEPMIVSLQVTPPGGPGAASGPPPGGGPPSNGRRNGAPESAPGVWQITWQAADVNDDDLVYAVHFKGRTEREWKLLAEDLEATSYAWATESAPEGTMQVRVTVSDRPSNPPALAREGSRVSAPFDIDHTDPVVALQEVTTSAPGVLRITGSAGDATTVVREVSYSVNSGPWRVVFPADGIFDSSSEALDFTVDGLSAGEVSLVVRAKDERGNVGVAKRVITLER